MRVVRSLIIWKHRFSMGSLGLLEYSKMAFGLSNAPISFQRLMERCKVELQWNDDISILVRHQMHLFK